MALTIDTWEKAKYLYEGGDSLNKISKELDINCANLARKAREYGWLRAKGPAEGYLPYIPIEIQEADPKTFKEFVPSPEIGKQTINEGARAIQKRIFETVLRVADTIDQFIAAHPDGTYIKKGGSVRKDGTVEGVTYGLTSEVLSGLSAIANATAAITREDKVTVTNNTQVNSHTVPTINIEYIST